MAVLKIYSPIVDDDEKATLQYWGLDGVSFSSVDEFVGNIPEEDGVIDIRLHCPGGSVAEGWAIVDRLRSTGKEIRATIEGTCASMASVVLLAASVRRGAPHATLLIHDPFIPAFTLADEYTAEELRRITDDLAAERERILDFYVERTGSARDTLDAQMREGTAMDMERARELGFIQEITAPASARARGWAKDKTYSLDMKKKGFFTELKALLAKYGGDEPKAVDYELNTADGGKITVDKEEGEEPAVGDVASPDGEHLMPDGSTIVIEDGVITDIRPAAEEEETEEVTEIEELKTRVAELERQLEDARAQAKTDEELEILNLVRIAGGRDWLVRAKSAYKPEKRDMSRKGAAGRDVFADLLTEARKANGMKEKNG